MTRGMKRKRAVVVVVGVMGGFITNPSSAFTFVGPRVLIKEGLLRFSGRKSARSSRGAGNLLASPALAAPQQQRQQQPQQQPQRPERPQRPRRERLSSGSNRQRPLVDPRQVSDVEKLYPGVDFDVPITYSGAAKKFFAHPSVGIACAGLVGALAMRAAAAAAGGTGALSLLDVAALPTVYLGWIFQEWALHKYLLHPPSSVSAYSPDPASSSLSFPERIHAEHHALPYYHVSIDGPELVGPWMATAAALFVLGLPQPLGWTVTASYITMGLAYMWTHFLAHTRVASLGERDKRSQRHHMRHHLRDCRAWFAFLEPGIDQLLKTDHPPLLEPGIDQLLKTDHPPEET